MKITKNQLKNLIREAIHQQLSNVATESRIRKLDKYKLEAGVTYYELLEDVIEQLDDNTWNEVLEGFKEKYGYRR